MTHPVIGWENETSIPDRHFNDLLSARNGHLFMGDLDLADLFPGIGPRSKSSPSLTSPLEIIYLPKIREKIASLRQVFDRAIHETGYGARFLYSYPSKANAAEEVVRTILDAGVNYEISSAVDVDILRLMLSGGHLSGGQIVICNGFKPGGSVYAGRILELLGEHENVIPVIENLQEIQPLLDAGVYMNVGLRQKSYGHFRTARAMTAVNSRFGMCDSDLWQAAQMVTASSNLHLRLYHAMVGSQIVDATDFVGRLKPAMEVYARLRQHCPELQIFNFGGGLPAPMTLNFSFDYEDFARRLLSALQATCSSYSVPVPDVMGEFGRYTVAEHGAHCFKVILAKENRSAYPWYIIDGSIMTSFPDVWALGEHFVVLPLNHLDGPFRRVQLGGITCDSDDIYPPKGSRSPLYLPVDADELYVGFFNIGAYQEMLGGVGGTKHCVLPEANELIVDRGPGGQYEYRLLPGQNPNKILGNLGYVPSDAQRS